MTGERQPERCSLWKIGNERVHARNHARSIRGLKVVMADALAAMGLLESRATAFTRSLPT